MYLGHVSGRKVVPDCRRLGSSASDCRLQKGYPLCACQHTDGRAWGWGVRSTILSNYEHEVKYHDRTRSQYLIMAVVSRISWLHKYAAVLTSHGHKVCRCYVNVSWAVKATFSFSPMKFKIPLEQISHSHTAQSWTLVEQLACTCDSFEAVITQIRPANIKWITFWIYNQASPAS